MAKVVRVKAQQQAMTSVQTESEPAPGRRIDGDQRLDRRQFVCPGFDTTVIVGCDQALFTGNSIRTDGVDAIALRTEAGRLDRDRHFALGSGIVADELEARRFWGGPRREANNLAVEGPVALRLLRDSAIIELIAEAMVFLELQRGADLHPMRLVRAGHC